MHKGGSRRNVGEDVAGAAADLEGLRSREPDFGRLEELLESGLARYEARTGEHLTRRRVGPKIDHSTALISGMLGKKNRPGPDVLVALADLFDDEREVWLDAGGFEIARLPKDRGYTTLERDIVRGFRALDAAGQAEFQRRLAELRRQRREHG